MLEGDLPDGGRYRLHRLRSGGIGWAAMTPDRTIVLDIHLFDSLVDVLVDRAIAYPASDPRHAEVAAHVGGLEPGEMKPIRHLRPWCLAAGEAAVDTPQA